MTQDAEASPEDRYRTDFSKKPSADDARYYIELLNERPPAPGDREAANAAMIGMERGMCEGFRILREERGWSQAELSERLAARGIEMHQTTIAKMESGKRALRVAEMFALGYAFGMPPGAVFFMDTHPALSSAVDELTAAIAEKEQLIERHKAETLNVIDHFIETSAELQTKRNELIRLVREAGKTDG